MLAIDRSSPWNSMPAKAQLDSEQSSIFIERSLTRARNCAVDRGCFCMAAWVPKVDRVTIWFLLVLMLWLIDCCKVLSAEGDLVAVAEQAQQRSKVAQVLVSVRSETLAVPTKKHLLAKPKISEQERAALCNLSLRLEKHLRFETAVNAVRLHYAIAACLQAQQDNAQLRKEIDLLLEDQQVLIDKGLAIEDPTALQRAKIACEDSRLSLASKLSTLREELAALIDPDVACAYSPELITTPHRTLDTLCDVQEEALRQRADLQAIHYAVHALPGASDGAWEIALNSANQVASVPGVATVVSTSGGTGASKVIAGRMLSRLWNQGGDTAIPQRRVAILNQLYRVKAAEIEVAVAKAFHARELAVDRWSLAVETTNTWQTRLEQLIALEEVQGTLAKQVATKLEIYRARSQELERWLEWQLADCDLQLASGAYGFWNREESPAMQRTESKANEDSALLKGSSQGEEDGE